MKITASLVLSALLALTASEVHADEPVDPVIERIASMIADIDGYVVWPEAKAAENKPFFVAVLGDSPLAKRIKKLNRTKLSDGRRIKVRLVQPDLLPSNAHIILITPAAELDASLLKKLKGTATLTITSGHADLPTVIHVDKVKSSEELEVRTTIDIQLAAEEKLDIKQKLKDVAVVVGAPSKD
jgi:hypothetical protein